MPLLKLICSDIRKIKVFLSYKSYEGTRKVKEITNDPLMDRPILLYEKISKILRIRPYFLGILLIAYWPFALWLNYITNSGLFWRTFTFNGLITNFIISSSLFLAFFYFLPYMKVKYFETVEDLRPVITKRLYEELKSKFVRKRVLYLGLLIIYISILVTVSYEIILGFKVGFWTENMPAWSVFRFGLASVIFGLVGVITFYMFGADAFNGCVSWLMLPFLLDKDVTKYAYRDPEILGNVEVFEKFNKNLVNMTLITVLIISLALFWVILKPVPVPPTIYVWITIILFLFVPLISASRLRGRTIKKLIDILKDQYESTKNEKLGCEAAKNADKLSDVFRAKNDHIRSQESLETAAEEYEKCGAYPEAAKRYSKLGNYKKAAECYNNASDKEDDAEKKKYYKACAYIESAEEFIEAYNRLDEASECLNLAANYFNDIAEITSNHDLETSTLYRSREAKGRLLVLDALKIYDDYALKIHEDKNDKKRIDKVLEKLTEAKSIFEKTSKLCPGIGTDAEKQLVVHASMCEFYRCYISFKHTIHESKIVDTNGGSTGIKIFGITITRTKKRTKEYRSGEFRELDECITIIQAIHKKLLTINKLKAAKKAEVIEYALVGYKLYKQGKKKEALENVEIAENILKNVFGKPVDATTLHTKIDELTNSIFYTGFQFSAPMCVALDPDAYKNCIEFENETEVPKEVSRNNDVLFTFKLCYKPCKSYLESPVNLALRLNHLGRNVLRELNLKEGEKVHEQFLVPGKDIIEGKNYIRADLFHLQKKRL
jgi:tetratricopeptide (TPR) repeat protein